MGNERKEERSATKKRVRERCVTRKSKKKNRIQVEVQSGLPDMHRGTSGRHLTKVSDTPTCEGYVQGELKCEKKLYQHAMCVCVNFFLHFWKYPRGFEPTTPSNRSKVISTHLIETVSLIHCSLREKGQLWGELMTVASHSSKKVSAKPDLLPSNYPSSFTAWKSPLSVKWVKGCAVRAQFSYSLTKLETGESTNKTWQSAQK